MDEAKRDLVRDWLLKASRDPTVAKVVARSPEAIWEASLYHCQQAAEKALKGFLAYWDFPIERTHNLLLLLKKASQIDPCFDPWKHAAARSTPYSTAYRYPGTLESPDLEQVTEALDDAAGLVNQVLSVLPPEVRPHTYKNGDSSTADDATDSKPES
jgi:HEPN domain-containing protein